jgi:hypothetical protein
MVRAAVAALALVLTTAACARPVLPPQASESRPSPVVAAADVAPRVPRTCGPYEIAADFGQHGVVRMPREVWVRALAPVLVAACACARSVVRLAVIVTPNLGEIRARAPEDAETDRCLAAQLGPIATFASFDMGEGSDCISCGPQHVAKRTGVPLPAWLAPPAVRPWPRGPSFVIRFEYAP